IFDAHADTVGAVDHVKIGDDITIGVQDYARAERALAAVTLAVKRILVVVGVLSEVAIKEILEGILALSAVVGASRAAVRLAVGFGADVHHRRTNLFDDLPEGGAELLWRLHR